jgi:1-acyl-sn-glycerol-3-phosphate acyltransferase
MKSLRVCHRIFRFSVVTALSYLFLLAGKIVLFFSKNRRVRWRNLVVHFWAKMLAQIFGLRITVNGRPPQTPFFLVSNHLSYIDVIVFFTQVHCIFVAKAELQSWPVFGFLAKSANTLFINRNSKKDIPRVNALIEQAMHESDGVLIFPEGTSTAGSEVLPFKSPLLEYAAERNFPVSFASLHYHTAPPEAPASLSVCWWGDMTFGSHFIEFLKLSKIEATIEFGTHTVSGNDRKTLAQELWSCVNQQFAPTHENQI